METRIARLESEVAHAATAADVRALQREMDLKMVELSRRIDGVQARLEKLREARFNTWIVMIALATNATLVIALAHGFGWI